MKKNARMLTALAVSGAMLLSGCYPSALLPEKSPWEPDTTGGNNSGGNGTTTTTPSSGEPAVSLSGDRGTLLSLRNDKLEIQRLSRDSEVPMGDDGVWTVFVYLCGSNLESEGGLATYDIEEMVEATENSSKLRFVVEAGGSEKWYNNQCDGGKSQRVIVQDGDAVQVSSDKARNMGSPESLAGFISWGLKNYASEHMALVLWDHGGGSISGVCFDELYGNDSLYLEEIDTALASVYGEMTDRFELIGFDACLMATLETANVLVPYARYMVASQELESGYGWDYTCFGDAVKNGVDNGKDMGRYICDGYYSFASLTGEEDVATMSVTDLSKVDEFLELFNDFARDVYDYAGNGGMTDIIKAAKSTMNFGSNNYAEGYTNMIDLLGFIDNAYYYSDHSYDAEIMLADQLVVYTNNGYFKSYAGGLSLYYPLCVQGSMELDIFRNISVSPYYLSLVDLCAYGSDNNGYIGGYDLDEWLNDSSGFWSDLFNWDSSSYDYWDDYDDGSSLNTDYSNTSISFIDSPQLTSGGYYYFRLTQESLYSLDTVYCNIMMSYWDDEDNCEYMLDLGTDDYVDLDWDTGECYDNFSGYWFALPDGQPLCAYLTEVFYDPDTTEYYNLYTCPIYINDKFTYLRIKQSYSYSGMTTEILGAWDGIDQYGSADRDLYQLQAGDRICPCYPAYDAYTYEYVLDFYGYDYVYTGNAEIGEDLLYEGDYYYAFEIYDLYGNALYTDFVLFGVDADGSLYYYE